MNLELLKDLACPYCVTKPESGKTRLSQATLELQGSPESPTGLQCKTCGRLYKVEHGIPNLLIDEAVLPEKSNVK
jgi:uncharacterized protein YbaR (Trm112 family)